MLICNGDRLVLLFQEAPSGVCDEVLRSKLGLPLLHSCLVVWESFVAKLSSRRVIPQWVSVAVTEAPSQRVQSQGNRGLWWKPEIFITSFVCLILFTTCECCEDTPSALVECVSASVDEAHAARNPLFSIFPQRTSLKLRK